MGCVLSICNQKKNSPKWPTPILTNNTFTYDTFTDYSTSSTNSNSEYCVCSDG